MRPITRTATRWAGIAAPTLIFFVFLGARALAYPGDVMSTGTPVKGPDRPQVTTVPSGTWGVSETTGAAEFSIPIFTPAGRRGMQPSLSLVYSSHNPLRGGVAVGWQLPIDSISVDTSQGRLAGTHYTSTLVGGQRLVRVNEPAFAGRTDVITYRGEHDSNFLRFEHVFDGESPAGYWRVRSPSGVTQIFGQTPASRDEPSSAIDSYATEGRWFLNRSFDRFGNTVHYIYQKVRGGARNGSQTNVPIDIALSAVEYTSNPVAGLPPHVRIEFGYASELAYCKGSDIPIGAQFTYRNGFRTYEGARRLDEIRVSVIPNANTGWQLRRTLSLSYDPQAASCHALHAPLRMLTSVQETGYAPGKPSISLPPVTFTYGRIQHNFDDKIEVPEIRLTGLGSGKRRLSREKAGGWPTVDTMWLDLDGDGAPDQLRSTPSSSPSRPCDFQWRRNRGNGSFDDWRSSSLPTLPWAVADFRNTDGDPWNREQCSLAAQFDRRATPYIDPVCGRPANYNSYRFMDVTGDGRPDLVTAMDYQSGQYDPTKDVNLLAMGHPGAPDVCSQPAPCRDPKTGDPIPCYFEPISQSMPFAPGGGYTPDQTGCTEGCRSPTCGPLDTNCPCSAMYCKLDDTSVYDFLNSPPEENRHPTGAGDYWAWKGPSWPSAFSDGSSGGGSHIAQNAACRRRVEMSCNRTRFVWRVFKNLGDGTFAQQPSIIDAPIPLESDRMTAQLGTANLANASDWNAIIDIDGDGYDDAVWQFPTNASYGYGDTGYFLVFRGDGQGHFLPDANGNPYKWPTPPMPTGDGRRRLSSRTAGRGTLDSPTNTVGVYHYTETRTTLADVNGDGLPDLIDTRSATPGVRQLNVYYNTGTGFETEPAGTVLAPATELDTPDREAQIPVSFDQDTLEMDAGYSIATRRMIDIDGDGLADMFTAPLPPTGSVNPWVHQDVNGNPDSATAYMNVGDRLVPVGSSAALEHMRDALERIMLTYDQKWHVKTDYFDFDGDGYADVFNADRDENGHSLVGDCVPNVYHQYPLHCGLTSVVQRDSNARAQGMHMLQKIDNGYGASVRFTYAPTTEVAPGQLGGRRAPAPVWVVTKMAVDPGLAAPGHAAITATTTYDYSHPVYNRDERGRYGFRGFEQTTTHSPANADGKRAQKVTRYDYTLDPTGRRVGTVTSDQDGKLQSVSKWTWDVFPLFGGRVRIYETTDERAWSCGASDTTEAACRANAPVLRKLTHFVPVTVGTTLDSFGRLDASLGGSGTPISWIMDWSAAVDHDGAIRIGDRRNRSEYAVYYGSHVFHILPTLAENQAAIEPGGDRKFGAVEVFGRTQTVYDDGGLGFPVVSKIWNDDHTISTTELEFDRETGLEVARTRPNQVGTASPKKILTTYGPNKVYPTQVLNELGWGPTTTTDPATGAVLETSGPAQGSRTPIVENDYDALGRLTETRRTTETSGTNLVTVSKVTYDDSSVPRKVTTQSLVDSKANLWNETTTTLDPLNRPLTVTTQTTAGPATTTYEYDGAGNTTSLTSPNPAVDGSFVTTRYHYDAFGHLTRYEPPVGAATELHYDGLSTTIVIGPPQDLGRNDSPSRTLGRRVDVFGRLVEVTENTDDGTATTTYEYDYNGNLDRTVSADQIETTFEHDWTGHRTAIHRQNVPRPWLFFYDLDGNMIAKTTPFDGPASLAPAFTTTWAYDALDRQTSKWSPTTNAGTATSYLRSEMTLYQYDVSTQANSLGRLSRAIFQSGITYYDYTLEGRVSSERRRFRFTGNKTQTFTDTRTQTWHYNEAGEPTSQSTGDSTSKPTTLFYKYDRQGQPVGLKAAFSGFFMPIYVSLATLHRDRLGEVRLRSTSPSVFLPRGGVTGTSKSTMPEQRWSYDELGRVVGHQVTAGDEITGEKLSYDALSNLRSATNLGSDITLHYTYDSQHQLATATSSPNTALYAANFEYTTGGRLKTAYVGSQVPGTDVLPRDVQYNYAQAPFDPEALASLTNPVTGATFARYTQDARGNRTSAERPGIETQTYSYDGSEHLREASIGTASEKYEYDQNGARMLVASTAVDGQPARVRFYFGNTEIWYDWDGNVQKTIIHANLGAMPVARIENASNAQISYIFSGVLGNVLAVTTATGDVQAKFTYGPFGEILQAEGPKADEIRRRFNGKELDRLTRLSYYGARYYDRASMTWTQADPLYRFAPDVALTDPRRSNLYTFSLNNPVRFFDPDGLDDKDKNKKKKKPAKTKAPLKSGPIANVKVTPLDGSPEYTFIDGNFRTAKDGATGPARDGYVFIGTITGTAIGKSEYTYGMTAGQRSTPIYVAAPSNGGGNDKGKKGGEGDYVSPVQMHGALGWIDITQSTAAELDGLSKIAMVLSGGFAGLSAGLKAVEAEALEGGGLTLFHGTDTSTAGRLLGGEGLDAELAAASKIDGPPGFFLATHPEDAAYFAARRGAGSILEFQFSTSAISELGGLPTTPLGPLGKFGSFLGSEAVISPAAFDTFNMLRKAGEILVAPH